MRMTSTQGSLQALLVFTRLFAELTHHGVQMWRCAQILAEDAPAPYNDFARLLRGRLANNKTLTQCLAESPELFPPFYRTMIHASEIGGIIDEFLGYLAELLAEQLEMEPLVPAGEGPLHLGEGTEHWSGLSEPQRLLALSIWCRSLSMLLAARVPRRIALETVADLLPSTECYALRRIAGEIQGEELAGCLKKAGFLPATALVVIANGDAGGELDLALERLARLYHDILRNAPAIQSADITQCSGTRVDAGRLIDDKRQDEGKIPIGKILLDSGKISRDQLKQALTLQKSTTEELGRLLIDLGFVSEQDVRDAYARQRDLPLIPDPGISHIIPEHLQKRYDVVSLRGDGTKLFVAMADPTNVNALDDLRLVTGFDIEPVPMTREEILAIRRGISESAVEDAPIIRMVNVLIQNAIKQGTTEIHLLPDQRQVSVQFCLKGEFREVMTLPKFAHLPLVERLKMMADISLDAEPPQQGRIYLRNEGQDYDAFTEVTAGEHGEMMTLRIVKRPDLECGG